MADYTPPPRRDPMQLTLKLNLVEPFKSAYEDKQGLTPKLRSALFVQRVVKNLQSITRRGHPFVQKVNLKLKKKVSGEWLLDGVIAKRKRFGNERSRRYAKAKITTHLLWAVESESATSLKAMCDDLGKLLVVDSQNYLYLNGLNQQPRNTHNYVERRLKTVKGILAHNRKFNKGNFYLGFWPSPKKTKARDSFWDQGLQDLTPYLKMFRFTGGEFKEMK